MSNSFTPLVTTPAPAGGASMFELKVLPQAEAKGAFEPLPPDARTQQQPLNPCSQPSVTLQREGDVVSAIRIQCGCGQVIELACAY